MVRYLKGTPELGIWYDRSGDNTLIGYSDADWGGDRASRRSTTGYIFLLNGGPISWGTRRQPTVALSTTEAEYMALCTASQEALHLRMLIADFGFPQPEPTLIHEDNQGCVALSNNPVFHKRTKHIEIRYHFVREQVNEFKNIVVRFIRTNDMLADIFTKPLNGIRFMSLVRRILKMVGFDIPES